MINKLRRKIFIWIGIGLIVVCVTAITMLPLFANRANHVEAICAGRVALKHTPMFIQKILFDYWSLVYRSPARQIVLAASFFSQKFIARYPDATNRYLCELLSGDDEMQHAAIIIYLNEDVPPSTDALTALTEYALANPEKDSDSFTDREANSLSAATIVIIWNYRSPETEPLIEVYEKLRRGLSVPPFYYIPGGGAKINPF